MREKDAKSEAEEESKRQKKSLTQPEEDKLSKRTDDEEDATPRVGLPDRDLKKNLGCG